VSASINWPCCPAQIVTFTDGSEKTGENGRHGKFPPPAAVSVAGDRLASDKRRNRQTHELIG